MGCHKKAFQQNIFCVLCSTAYNLMLASRATNKHILRLTATALASTYYSWKQTESYDMLTDLSSFSFVMSSKTSLVTLYAPKPVHSSCQAGLQVHLGSPAAVLQLVKAVLQRLPGPLEAEEEAGEAGAATEPVGLVKISATPQSQQQ